jgi:hypothetical protein
MLISVPSQAQPGKKLLQAAPPFGAGTQVPGCPHPAVARKPQTSFEGQSPLVWHVPGAPSKVDASAAQLPACASGLETPPFGSPVQAMLISVPSHAHPGEYAWQTTVGAGTHVPGCPHPAVGEKAQTSPPGHGESVVHEDEGPPSPLVLPSVLPLLVPPPSDWSATNATGEHAAATTRPSAKREKPWIRIVVSLP